MAIDQLSPPALARGSLMVPARRSLATDALVLAALLWWGTGLTFGTGGREQHVLSVGLILLIPGIVVVRPWERLPTLACASVGAAGVGAFAVALFAPTGWAGASEAASWVYATQLGVLLLAWARDSSRQRVLLAALAVLPVLSFAQGWLAWWGGGDPSVPFIGTFYWHNQEAIYLGLGVVAGTALLVQCTSWLIGLLLVLAVALSGAGVVLSTSRGSMIVVAFVLTVMLVVAVWQRSLRAAAVVAAVPAVITGTTLALSGPPFFVHHAQLGAGVVARASQNQSVSTNGGYRLNDWEHALRVFLHWPTTGSGFHGLAGASRQIDPEGHGSLTPFAHNGFLQVFSDGGLLLGLPFLALCACAAVLLLRQRKAFAERDWTSVGAIGCVVAVMLHSGMDFDWSYPALLGAAGISVAAVGLRSPRVNAQGEYRSGRSIIFSALTLMLLIVSCVAAWKGGLHLNSPVGRQS